MRPHLKVVVGFGDFEVGDHPHADSLFFNTDAAIIVADETFSWMKTVWLPRHGEQTARRLGTDNWAVMVRSYDASGTCLETVYLRGNPRYDA